MKGRDYKWTVKGVEGRDDEWTEKGVEGRDDKWTVKGGISGLRMVWKGGMISGL